MDFKEIAGQNNKYYKFNSFVIMKTYTTREGIVHCSNCGSYLGDIDKEPGATFDSCGTCDQIENSTNEDF